MGIARGCVICLWIFCSRQGDLWSFFSLAYTAYCQFQKRFVSFFLAISISFYACFWFEEEEEERRATPAAAYQWSGKHDDETLRVVKCRWRKCGAVLQSRAHCLKHVQVMHVGELVVHSFVLRKRSVMANPIHSGRGP